jgi:flagellar biogenesis protein FliO
MLTMVFSLGAILGCLLIAAYLVRRYLFSPATAGKRAASLRVLARTHITPKAVVALLEVPGKTLVIGVTGSTLVTLGEVVTDPDSASKEAPALSTNGTSFAIALEQSANEDSAAESADETLWQVSERIQRKVSRLKQL